MKWLAVTVLFCLLASTPVIASFETEDPLQEIEDLRAAQAVENAKIETGRIYLEKKDYLRLIVSSYVNGFKEFDTTVATFDDSVKVSIYYDSAQQNRQRADQLAKRFREKIPPMLEAYRWAENITVSVSVYGDPGWNKQE